MFLPMTALASHFRTAVEAFLERTGTAPARLGLDALRDPSFVHRLTNGREPRLETADRVLAFMGEEPVGPGFRCELEAFIAVTRTKASLLGHYAAGDLSFVTRIRRGASPRLDTADRVLAWIAEHCSEAERAAIREAVRNGGTPVAAISTAHSETAMLDNEIYMSTREVAAFLGLSPRTLDRYRVTGDGPPFHRFGNRVRYARADVEAWAAARRVRSTSDEGQLGGRAA